MCELNRSHPSVTLQPRDLVLKTDCLVEDFEKKTCRGTRRHHFDACATCQAKPRLRRQDRIAVTVLHQIIVWGLAFNWRAPARWSYMNTPALRSHAIAHSVTLIRRNLFNGLGGATIPE